MVAGSIGGAGRLSFSVIGDAVNLCSRVEAATRDTGDPVLITGETRALLSETIEVESRGEREIRGYDRKVELYAPLVPVAVGPTGPDGRRSTTRPVSAAHPSRRLGRRAGPRRRPRPALAAPGSGAGPRGPAASVARPTPFPGA